MKHNHNEKDAYDKGYRITSEGLISYNNKLFVGGTNKAGYHIISFRTFSGERKKALVHRLQAYQKFGNIIYDEGMVIKMITV